MKKTILLFGLLLFISVIIKAQNVKISGKTVDWKEGEQVILDGNQMFGETKVKNGEYTFAIQLDEPQQLMLRGGNKYIYFMAAPGEIISIAGTAQKPVIKGSSLQADFEKYVIAPFERQNKQRSVFFQKYREIVEKGELDEEFRKSQDYQDYLKAKETFEAGIVEDYRQLVGRISSTIFAPMTLVYASNVLMPTEEMYAGFSEEVKNSIYGKKIRKKLGLWKGKKAPEFSAKDADGKSYTLADLMKGNKYLLIDFWASWCVPCRKSIPEMKEFAKKYADKGLVIVSISRDSKAVAWKKALAEEQMTWVNLWDETGEIGNLYGVDGIPSVFLLDSDGVVLFEKLYGAAVGTNLKKILGY